MDAPHDLRIVDLSSLDESDHAKIANLLVIGFANDWPNAWPTLEDGLDEVKEFLNDERVCRIAISEGLVLGWIGGIPQYDGHAWELQPLVVHPDYQRMGIGTALVFDLEAQLSKRGAVTIFLGADDENEMTSLAGIDLYPDVLENLSGLKNLRSHPFDFYTKVGYSVVGVIPDANGLGKHDIMMAKRVSKQSTYSG